MGPKCCCCCLAAWRLDELAGAEEAEAEAEEEEDEEDDDDDDEVNWFGLLVVLARSKVVVESTANSVGEPTRSNVIDEALDAGPEVELLVAVEVTELKSFVCGWLVWFTTTIKWPLSSCICWCRCCCCCCCCKW